MPNPVLSSLILPVKNASTGAVMNVEYDLPAGGGVSYIELTENAASGATSVAFTDSAITASATFDVYSTEYTSITGMSISESTLTVTFQALSSARTFKLRIS